MAILPMAVYGLEVPAGGVPIAAKTDIPAAVSFPGKETHGYKLTRPPVSHYNGRH